MPETQVIPSDRAAIANEVWSGSAEQSPETINVEPIEVAPEPEVIADPWAGIPTALKDEVVGMRAKVADVDAINFRLKQTESRLGGVLNELHAAKEAAKAVANAPTKAQIDQASTSQGKWNALKEDFPDWTEAMDEKLAADRAEILSKLPDIEALRSEMQAANAKDREVLEVKMGSAIVSLSHPKWQEMTNTPDYIEWHKQTGQRDSLDPLEVIAIFDEFKAFKSKQKSTQEIVADRKKRLELAQTTSGHKLAPIKSEADMSASELRASVARQVWS